MASDINISVKLAVQQANKNLESLNRNLKSSVTATDRFANATKGAGSAFKVFAGNLAAIGVAKLASTLGRAVGSVFDFGVASVKVAGEMETLRTQFEVLTGSAGLANKAVRDLQEFSARTPFQFKDLAQAQQRLLSFGFSLEQSSQQLEVLGDVSAASGAGINELALIFGQVNAAGKLTGERLLQFQERAIPIGPAIAKTMGVAESAVKDLVSAGKVDFATFERAFQSLNQTGEFAFNGMVKRSETLEGRLSTLSDNFKLLQANIGARLQPAFKALLTTVTLFIQRIQQTSDFNGFLETIAQSIPKAVRFLIETFQFLTETFFAVRTTLNDIKVAFAEFIVPILQVVKATAQMDLAIAKFTGSSEEYKNGLETQIAATDDWISSLAEGASEAEQSNERIEKSRLSLNQTIDESGKFLLETIKKETQAAIDQEKALADSGQKKNDKIKELSAEEQAALTKLGDAKQKLAMVEEQQRIFNLRSESVFQDERLQQLEEFFTRQKAAEIQAGINLAATETEKQRLITEAMTLGIQNRLNVQNEVGEAEITAFIETQEARLAYIGEVLGQEEMLRETARARELAARGDFKAAEDSIEAARVQARRNDIFALQNFEELSQRERLSNLKSTLGTISTLQSSQSRKAFEVGKAAAIAQATIDGIRAVQTAYASPPGPPFNLPIVAATALAVGANVQKIASQQPPKFAQGGIVPGQSLSGDRVQARVNSGEMILNRQQQANLFRMAQSGGGGGQEISTNITVELDGEVVGRAVSRQVANGLQLGEVQ